MPAKGYWIGNNVIHDMDGLWRYRDANRDTMNRYGARFIVMHGSTEPVESQVVCRIEAASKRDESPFAKARLTRRPRSGGYLLEIQLPG